MLLAVEPHDEGGHVDDLLADADVPLADEDARVVDALGQPQLEHLGLEAALQEVLHLEAQHVIELHAALIEDSDADEAPEEGVSLEEPLGVPLLQGEELPGGLADLGEGELDPPDLALVPEPVLPDELELLVEAGLLVGPARGRVDLGVDGGDAVVHHRGAGGGRLNDLRKRKNNLIRYQLFCTWGGYQRSKT